MNRRRIIAAVWISSLALCLFSGSALTASPPNPDETINWSARLFPDNTDYLEVWVDARNIASNRVIKSASFDVTFYDEANRRIRTTRMSFLDSKFPSFTSGTYRRFFKHSQSAAKRIEGGTFRIYGVARGGEGKIDEGGSSEVAQAKASAWGSRSARSIDPTPPSR